MNKEIKGGKITVINGGGGTSGTTKVELTPREQKLKDRLVEIEETTDSIERVFESICQDNIDSLFNDETFPAVILTGTITATTKVIAEYLATFQPKETVTEITVKEEKPENKD